MKALIFAVLSTLLMAGAAASQTYEVSVQAARPIISDSPLGSLDEQRPRDNDTTLKGKSGGGARFTLNTPGYYGHEFSYFRHRATLRTTLRDGSASIVREDGIRIQQASYNFLIYFMPRGERWRPYITGGLQLHDYAEPNIAGWTRGSSRNYGANWGGGLKIRLFPHAFVRIDFRDFFGGKPYDLRFEEITKSGGILRQKEGSVGIAIGF